jgi:hypothetical protein
MRKSWFFVSLLVVPFLIFPFLNSLRPGKQATEALYAQDDAGRSLLPVIIAPEASPMPEPNLINGSFEDGWVDVTDRVQRPNNWDLYRIPVGDPLFDSTHPDDVATGTCECKHLLNHQLPVDQQVGGPDALILDGLTVYKLFGVYEKWGSELSQTIAGLTPGSNWRVTVPIRVHLHEDPGEWSAESSVWVNDVGYWANGIQMGDQNWCKLEQTFVVPVDGSAEIAIRVKSKYALPKDFFIDDIRLQPEDEPAPYQDMELCVEKQTLLKYRPAKSRR